MAAIRNEETQRSGFAGLRSIALTAQISVFIVILKRRSRCIAAPQRDEVAREKM
jgi:hypothetical protein